MSSPGEIPAGGNIPDVTTLPERSAPGNIISSQEGEGEAGIRPTRWEQYGARFRQLSQDLPVTLPFITGDHGDEVPGALPRMYQDWTFERSLEGRPKITKDEANARFPGMPVPFDEAVYPEVAQARYNYAKRRQLEQQWIDRGPEVGHLSTLAVGLTGALDPVNIATGLATGMVGEAGLLAAASRGYSIGRKTAFATSLASNFAANFAGELPAYFHNKSQNLEVDLGASAEGAFYGALGGTALHVGLKPLLVSGGERLNRFVSAARERFRGVAPAVQEKMLREGVTQHLNGEQIDTTTSATNMELRGRGFVQPGGPASQYRYSELTHPSEAAHYRAVEAEANAPVIFSPELGGGGVHAVDNPVVANNHAGTPESQFHGKIEEVHVDPNAKFINLDEPLPKSVIDEVIRQISEIGGADAEALRAHIEKMAGRDVLKSLHESGGDPDAVQAAAAADGFDGYRYVEGGQDSPSHNVIKMFEEGKGSAPGVAMETNRDIVPHDPAAEAAHREQVANSPEAQVDYSPEIEKKMEAQAARAPIDQAEVDPLLVAQHQDAINRLKRLAEEDPTIHETLQELKHQEAKDKQEIQALKDLIECAGSDIL